jgi:hypothetical protein
MFDHVTIHASDRVASERFYDTVLPTVGFERTYSGEDLAEWDDFSVSQAEGSVSRRLHIGFAATPPASGAGGVHITRATTRRSCSTPTATTSRS